MKRLLLVLALALAVSAEDCGPKTAPRSNADYYELNRQRDDSLKVVCWYHYRGGLFCIPESQLEPRGPES